MRYILYTFLLLCMTSASVLLASSEQVAWKAYKKDVQKPIFLLLTDGSESTSDKKIFSDQRLVNMLNKDFYPIKVDANKAVDFKNRYLLMTPPSIAILNPNGTIFTKKRNYSAMTILRDLYNYFEVTKNKKYRAKHFNNITKREMFKTFYLTYFLEGDKRFINREKQVRRFFMHRFDESKSFFKVSAMKPLYDYVFALLNKKEVSVKELWIADAHVDALLNGKVVNQDHIYKGAYNNWSNPIKKIDYQDNIKFAELLIVMKKEEMAKKILGFLEKNSSKLMLSEKIGLKTLEFTLEPKEAQAKALKEVLANLDSKYLRDYIATLKAKLVLFKEKQITKEVLEAFLTEMENAFYNPEKGAFYDVKMGREPYGFRYIPVLDNIELAYLYTEAYALTKDYGQVMIAKYLLALMNKSSIDNLLFSKYILVTERLAEIDKVKE